MPLRDDRGFVDREILDIIPERFDVDPDGHFARKGAHTRLILTVALALLAVAALGVAARHILFGEAQKTVSAGVPVIRADDKPIKTKPEDRGGMDVPNQDKLVYERMSPTSDAVPQTERLLPPPELPQEPPAQPRKPSIKPAFPVPPAKDASNTPPASVSPAVPPTPPTPAGASSAAKPAQQVAAVPTAPQPALSATKLGNETGRRRCGGAGRGRQGHGPRCLARAVGRVEDRGRGEDRVDPSAQCQQGSVGRLLERHHAGRSG
jgi:hypothetical protein